MKRFRNTIILALAALAANTAMAFDFVQDGIYYNIQADGVEVTYKTLGECDNYSETVNIPATVSYLGTTYDVVSIGDYAFSGCVGLKQVSIPNTVNYIGVCAFAGCAWLESISIPASVTSIGLQAFNHCMNLQNMTVASGNAFYDSRNGCKGIVEKATSQLIAGCQKTIIPTSVTSVGAYAFVGDVK
ncbi:MAG: leucine-rich repeat domain-containing protein, partial [Muribaculaceae bacterium]|nr:leucine-rich repeat domain-containing protein [Muribaculaceae bacterium]